MTSPGIAILCGVLAIVPQIAAQSKTPSDLRVEVRLKNGSNIIGIAQSGRLCERRIRTGYIAAEDKQIRGVGIRVWYYKQQRGFVFLPYRNIDAVTELGAVSAQEIAALRSEVEKAEKARLAKAKAKADALAAAKAGELTPPVEGTDEKPALTQAQKDLLKEFPTDKWDRERYGKLQTARLLGKEIQGPEKRFVDVFEQWNSARRSRDGTGTPAPGPSPTDND